MYTKRSDGVRPAGSHPVRGYCDKRSNKKCFHHKRHEETTRNASRETSMQCVQETIKASTFSRL
eukprot:763940-Hanusia_phi.AAC.18